jgi:hypothetical protein
VDVSKAAAGTLIRVEVQCTWGKVGVIQVFIVERVVGILVVVIQAMRARRLGAVVRGSALLAASAIVTRDASGVRQGGEDEKVTRLPYAVPTLVAAVVVVAARGRWL